MRKKLRINRGITLIALVITIIVLLILAGVSISMLTGQNGILTQAQKAKNSTEQSSAKEKVELAVTGAIGQSQDGKVTIDNLKTEISNYGGSLEKNEFPTLANIDNNKFLVKSDGSVLRYKEMSEITGQETENTSTKDNLGNYIVVPAGFKIINPNDNVTDGIVIEDVSHEATAGSQFVWIPVGDTIKDSNGNTETITLSRYTFADDNVGTPTDKGSKDIEAYTEDTSLNHSSSYGNKIAKDIDNFKNRTIINQGYYIGRYESRRNGEQLTVKANDAVYNNIAQPKAATKSREMYKNNDDFESDLINSYAWDTAVYFLQTFDSRTNKNSLKPYSRQTSLNASLASQGTNGLEDISKQDIICNIWDMASNCREWTTETYAHSGYPSTSRGGRYDLSSDYANSRAHDDISFSVNFISFRVILYL